MTLDEFKAELERLAALIDEPLAHAAAAECGDPTFLHGAAIEVMRLFPLDKSAKPRDGFRLRLALSAHVSPVTYTYTP